MRIFRVTPRLAAVALLAVAGPRSVAFGEDAPSPNADLRTAGRSDAPLAERLAAARRLIAGSVPDAESGVRAAALLLDADAVVAAGLLRRALDADVVPADVLGLAGAVVRARLDAEIDATRRASLAAFALALGLRGAEFEPALSNLAAPGVADALAADGWPPTPDVSLEDPPRAPGEDVAVTRRRLWSTRHAMHADRLDGASMDDPAAARAGLDALVADGAESLPTLLAVARAPAVRTPPGRVPRRVRAIVALGVIGDRAAVDVLTPCLADATQDGWVRVAAATALGDIGDPRAIPALCRALYYTGDIHRPRDAWDYPGGDNTDVPADRWNTVEYYVVDVAVADALLRLGVGNAAEWLIRERLNPRSGRWRIRVLQDAVDAIQRAFPDAPRAYEPDAGLPGRSAAYEGLLAWWRKGPRLARALSEGDEGTRASARRIVETIGGKGVMELQIAKRAATLLGPAILPAVLDGLGTAKRVQRAELVLVLGTLGDRRAVEPLIAFTADPVSAVRGNAMLALARFVGTEDDPRLVGEAKDATNRIVTRAIEMLADPEASPRTTALEALAHARPRDDVRAALDAHAAATHPENDFADYRMSEDVARLVQSGEGADRVLGHLGHKDLFVRRFAFELVRAALDLEPDVFDPAIDPGTPRFRAFDPAVLAAAVARRRTPR